MDNDLTTPTPSPFTANSGAQVGRAETHVESALRLLEDGLSALGAQIDRLEGVAEPVLLPPNLSELGKAVAEPSGSPHANLLLQQAQRVHLLTDRLGEITGRIDL